MICLPVKPIREPASDCFPQAIQILEVDINHINSLHPKTLDMHNEELSCKQKFNSIFSSHCSNTR